MLVIVVENAPPRLRGRLAIWLAGGAGRSLCRQGLPAGSGDDLGYRSKKESKKAMPSWPGQPTPNRGLIF